MSRTGYDRDFDMVLKRERTRIEGRMGEILPPSAEAPSALHEAMRYSALEGGKRIRGILCLWSHRLFGDPFPGDALDAACSIEFLHAYTLIHDDLPALDDDDLRRGRASCHARFGEANAILAGDALQALAFETLARCAESPTGNVLEAMRILSTAAGSRMLVGGQVADLEGEGKRPGKDMVRFIHERKTGELIAASLAVGTALALGNGLEVEGMRDAGRKAGLAFQIADDLLDIEGEQENVGKALRKDSKKGKITWPACFGTESSHKTADHLINESIAGVRKYGGDADLEQLFRLILERVS